MTIDKVLRHTIVDNYDKLAKLAKPHKMKANVIPVWSLKYEKNNVTGFIHQDGRIERNGAQIQILGYRIKKIKKPFLSTWKRTLKNINEMLENSIKNYQTNIVKKKVINIVTFPKEKIDQLQKACEQLTNN